VSRDARSTPSFRGVGSTKIAIAAGSRMAARSRRSPRAPRAAAVRRLSEIRPVVRDPAKTRTRRYRGHGPDAPCKTYQITDAIAIAEAVLTFCKPLYAQIQTFWNTL
jgi:hypothetical protein